MSLASLIYDFSLATYRLGASVMALWNPKAAKWVAGQKQALNDIKKLDFSTPSIWVHCASLGEYEQARTVIDALRIEYPGHHLVITFFSPSGYEIVKPKLTNTTVLYLPLDSKQNAKLLLDAIKPALAVFVKYENWHHYLAELKVRNIPTISISALFRSYQVFFKWYGGFFRNMLRQYTQIFVQEWGSIVLLKRIDIMTGVKTGDTRFDRVWEIKQQHEELPIIEQFNGTNKLLVAGSTWPQDDELLVKFINEHHHEFPDTKYVIAPHEIDMQYISKLAGQLKVPVVSYSHVERNPPAKVMIIDSIGILSRTYRYGYVAYIGGGFGAGIHNTLEAAANGIPVIFGPNYVRFDEAVYMAEIGAAFPISDYTALEITLAAQLKDNKAGLLALEYVEKETGGTAKVMNAIKELLPVKP